MNIFAETTSLLRKIIITFRTGVSVSGIQALFFALLPIDFRCYFHDDITTEIEYVHSSMDFKLSFCPFNPITFFRCRLSVQTIVLSDIMERVKRDSSRVDTQFNARNMFVESWRFSNVCSEPKGQRLHTTNICHSQEMHVLSISGKFSFQLGIWESKFKQTKTKIYKCNKDKFTVICTRHQMQYIVILIQKIWKFIHSSFNVEKIEQFSNQFHIFCIRFCAAGQLHTNQSDNIHQ